MEELDALATNHTWDIVPCPPSVKPIGCKWVYSMTLKPDGSLDRYKARLVALANRQAYGIDYEETFVAVAKMTTVCNRQECDIDCYKARIIALGNRQRSLDKNHQLPLYTICLRILPWFEKCQMSSTLLFLFHHLRRSAYIVYAEFSFSIWLDISILHFSLLFFTCQNN